MKNNAINYTGHLRDGQDIPNAFLLGLYDHKKCLSSDVRVHTKQDLKMGYDRCDKHPSALWNVQCPYLRCLCKGDGVNGCKGDVLWFDHAMWMMVNNLTLFFPDDTFLALSAKFGAFLIWLSNAARMAVCHQVVFGHLRELMVTTPLEYADIPSANLLAD